jgi:type IV secretory pathway VirB2 component (pilin)
MKFQRIAVFVGLLALLVMPELALAAGPGEATAQRIITWLTGPLARLCAIIAIVAVGYGCFKGRIEFERGVSVIVGIVVIFGGAAIVDFASAA